MPQKGNPLSADSALLPTAGISLQLRADTVMDAKLKKGELKFKMAAN